MQRCLSTCQKQIEHLGQHTWATLGRPHTPLVCMYAQCIDNWHQSPCPAALRGIVDHVLLLQYFAHIKQCCVSPGDNSIRQ
jgi:hypothetical protein